MTSSPTSISETHALISADINGDGLDDLVTGKRFWSHGKSEPGSDKPARLYWFEAQRGSDGMTKFTPHEVYDQSGIGTQFTVTDFNGDGLLDIVISNKKGTYLHEQVASEEVRPRGAAGRCHPPFRTGGWHFVEDSVSRLLLLPSLLNFATIRTIPRRFQDSPLAFIRSASIIKLRRPFLANGGDFNGSGRDRIPENTRDEVSSASLSFMRLCRDCRFHENT